MQTLTAGLDPFIHPHHQSLDEGTDPGVEPGCGSGMKVA